MDFSSIESKRIASTHAAAKVNGVVQPKTIESKVKVPKEDLVKKFLNTDNESDHPIESNEEYSDHEEFTEENSLKGHNLLYKNQLLEDSSDSELDSDERVNGMFCAYFKMIFYNSFQFVF